MPGALNDLAARVTQRLAGEALRDLADDQLLDRFLAGEQTAFTILVERHAALVLAVCRRTLGQTQDAEDAFQSTFLILARRAQSIRGEACIRGWLYRVAWQVSRRLRQQTARRRELEQAASRIDAVPASQEVSWREGLARIDEELDALPAKYRQVLLACCLEGKSRDEVGQELGLSAGQVKGLLERARELLRQRLGRRGVVVPAGMLLLLLQPVSAQAATGPLLAATTQASLAFAAGQSQAIAPAVLMLAEGFLSALALARTLWAAGIGLILALVTAGSLWIGTRPETDRTATAETRPAAEKQGDRGSTQVRGRVKGIDLPGSSLTLVIPRDGGIEEERTLSIEPGALLRIAGRSVPLTEIQVGDDVRVRLDPDRRRVVELTIARPGRKR